MSWKLSSPPRREEYPEGTDWKCRTEGCDYTEPQGETDESDGCPKCGADRLWVVISRTYY